MDLVDLFKRRTLEEAIKAFHKEYKFKEVTSDISIHKTKDINHCELGTKKQESIKDYQCDCGKMMDDEDEESVCSCEPSESEEEKSLFLYDDDKNLFTGL